MGEDDAAFARRLFRTMRAVAREAGRLAALRQQLRAMDDDRWWFNDYQRGLVLAAIRQAQADVAAPQR